MTGKSILFVLFLFAIQCCVPDKAVTQNHLRVTNAWYQTWVANENEKGTKIFIDVHSVDPSVVFDSIIFRGQRLPANVTVSNNQVRVLGIITHSKTGIKSEAVPVNQPDQLLYTYQGKRFSYPLKGIKRDKMKYYQQ